MEENVPVHEARASLNYARIAPRKVKIVADLIRGKKVSEALKDAIDKSSFAFEEDAVKTSLSYNYSFDAKITSYLNNNNITVLSKDYSENILIKIVVKKDEFENFNEGLINLTNGTVNCEDKEICKYAF